jgi:hypothetical protein
MPWGKWMLWGSFGGLNTLARRVIPAKKAMSRWFFKAVIPAKAGIQNIENASGPLPSPG